MLSSRCSSTACLLAALAPLTAAVARQTPVVGQKLNGSLSAPSGRVHDAFLSGEYAVYHALQDGPASGLYTTKLGPDFANQSLYVNPAGVGGFETSPVGEQVLFRSGGAMRSIPVNGSAGALSIHSGASLFTRPTRLVPGGRYAVYFAGVGGPMHLYRARLDGTEPSLVLAGPYTSFADPEVSADGSMVVFAARTGAGSGYEVFAVPVRGGPVVSLSGGPLPFRNTQPRYAVSPDGSRAVYLADVVESGRHELFGAPTKGSLAPARLHLPLRANESVGSYFDLGAGGQYSHNPPFVITPDGSHVAFIALLHRRITRFHLLEEPIGGGVLPALLDSWPWPNEVPSDDGYSLGNLALDPTGRWIVFQVITVSDVPSGRGRLFSVWAKGGRPPVELTSGVVTANGGLPAPSFEKPSFRITADGSRVVFLLDGSPFSTGEKLFSVPIDGSARAVPLAQLPSGRSVLHYEIQGQSVVYLANPAPAAQFELFHAPLLGGQAPVRLNKPLPAGGRVVLFRARPGEVVYLADQDTRGVQELYYSEFP